MVVYNTLEGQMVQMGLLCGSAWGVFDCLSRSINMYDLIICDNITNKAVDALVLVVPSGRSDEKSLGKKRRITLNGKTCDVDVKGVVKCGYGTVMHEYGKVINKSSLVYTCVVTGTGVDKDGKRKYYN